MAPIRTLVLAPLLLAGCGMVTTPPQPPLAPAVPPPAPVVVKEPAKPAAPPKVEVAAPPKAAAAAPPKAAVAAPPKVAVAAPPKVAPAAPPKVAAPPPLDLQTLEQRLKDTSAVGLLTKLSLKNQVDDLVARFKAFHGGQRPPTLTELRPSFDLLLMKVLSLLQDKDTALARDIDASRNAIWEILSDRDKLARLT